MAFNWQTFRTRALTALVFVAVMLTGLLWNPWSFLILFSMIHFGCWVEYLKLVEKICQTAFHNYARLGFMLLGYGLVLLFCGSPYAIDGYEIRSNAFLPVSLAGFILLVIGIMQQKKITGKAFGYAAAGLLYISLSIGFMVHFQEKSEISFNDTLFVNQGNFIPVVIIGSIWINDTMAYLVGSFAGKTPLSKISPKKTWEGTIGGIILCVGLMGIIVSLIYLYSIELPFVLLVTPVALVAAVAGTFGDLLESKLKRLAGVKDSGSLMPGHGGFLDRFDSLLLATPFAWLYTFIFL